MADHYLLKTEPSEYSFADLLKDKETVWDGVSNPTAVIRPTHSIAEDSGELRWELATLRSAQLRVA